MSIAAGFDDSFGSPLDRREIGLWSSAATLVVAAHLAAAYYFSQVTPPSPMPAEAAPAIEIAIAPMVVAPDAVQTELAEVVDSISAEPVEEYELTAEPVPDPVVAPETEVVEPLEAEPVEMAEAETLEPIVETVEAVTETLEAETVEPDVAEEVVPDLVEAPLPEVAMVVPEERPEPKKPEPKPVPKKVTKKAPPKKTARPAPPPQEAARKSAENAPVAAAPKARQAAAGNGVSPARWQARVNAHLNRRKRYPAGASGSGTAMVRFTINPSGAVTSVSLARSSGNAAFDSAAVDLVRRASPVPAPPPSIARARLGLTVPVRFSR